MSIEAIGANAAFQAYANQAVGHNTGLGALAQAAAVSVDDLVADARRQAEHLNATLDKLVEYGVDCLGVLDYSSLDRGAMQRAARVSLTLNFKANKLAVSRPD